MMTSRSLTIRFTVLAAALTAGMGGCTKDIPIYRVPAFWQPDKFDAIAVMPFRNASTYPMAGEAVTAGLTAHLAANGTYDRVHGPQELELLLSGRDWRDHKEGDVPNNLRDLDNVQAALTGTVLMMEGVEESEARREPIYETDRAGNEYIAGYRKFHYYKNYATLSVTASLVSIETGETLHSTLAPITAHVESEGEDPEMTLEECVLVALDEVVAGLVSEFAITQSVIKVDPNEAFVITSGDYYDGEWEAKSEFTADETEMIVVIRLPFDADRNTFRLAVTIKDGREDLAEAEFTWSRDYPAKGHQIRFDPSEIAAAGGGPGNYVIKFYAGDEPVMEQTFTIVAE
ncbi:MAG: hypothetical protein ACYTFO_03140 [Planctomycetota bacterium]